MYSVDDLVAAADSPSIGSAVDPAQMQRAINTSMGRRTPMGGAPPRGIASWEGYHKTAPAHLTVNGSGYRNKARHKKVSPLTSMASKKTAITTFSNMSDITNRTSKPLVKTSVSKLDELMKFNRLF
jgi:hypothetical protein